MKHKPNIIMKIFDFTHKRVRLNGKSLTKFDLAYWVDQISPFDNMVISMDVFSYVEVANHLRERIIEKGRTIFGVKLALCELA